MTPKGVRKNVLLVEDNPSDVRLFERALERSDLDLTTDLWTVTDYPSAVQFLKKEGTHVNAPMPDIVFTDHHIPGGDGVELINYMKDSDTLSHLPVVLITGSMFDPSEVARNARLAGAVMVLHKCQVPDLAAVLTTLLEIAIL